MSLAESPVRPTFVGIGGMKCASTWVAECLRAHPEVFVTSPKEVHFFDSDKNFARGDEWYLDHFAGAGAFAARGEIGATYLCEAKSIAAMRETLGPVRVFVTLRDPVERFLSEYKHRIRSGELPIGRFRRLDTDTLQQAIARCPTLRDGGLYAARLDAFFSAFTQEKTLVLLKDDIDADPQAVLPRLYGFLGVDPAFVPPVQDKVVSRGIVPRSMMLEHLRQRVYGAVRVRAPWVIDWVRRARVAEAYRRWNARTPGTGVEVDPAVEAELRDRFADDIAATERLLGRSLAGWRTPATRAA